MKKLFVSFGVIIITILGIIYLDHQLEEGLKKEVSLLFTPDTMSRNTYDHGECTHYVFEKVRDDGNMIERSWNDAEHWAERAEADEYAVNDTPKEGAVLQTENGPIGHVAYIESVNDDQSIEISEMNLESPYEITERTIESDDIDDYSYIHPEENPHADKYIK